MFEDKPIKDIMLTKRYPGSLPVGTKLIANEIGYRSYPPKPATFIPKTDVLLFPDYFEELPYDYLPIRDSDDRHITSIVRLSDNFTIAIGDRVSFVADWNPEEPIVNGVVAGFQRTYSNVIILCNNKKKGGLFQFCGFRKLINPLALTT